MIRPFGGLRDLCFFIREGRLSLSKAPIAYSLRLLAAA